MRNRCIGPWTIYEDKTLIDLIEKYGPQKWSFISKALKGRSGKQCRERWYNHLSPDINMSEWSLEEEMLLLLMHNKLGNKWSELRKYLKGRTDNNIKNHWNSNMKKKKNIVESEYNKKLIEYKEKYNNLNDKEIEDIIIDDFKKVIEEEMKKTNEEKKKAYEKFKKMKISKIGNNQKNLNLMVNAYKIRKILGFRTHSKKSKKRGRKKLSNINISNVNSTMNKELDKNINNMQSNYDINNYNISTKDSSESNIFLSQQSNSAFKNLDSNVSTEMKTPMNIPQITKPIQIIFFNSPYKNQIKFTGNNNKIDGNKNPQKNLNAIFNKLE